ncbi:MAG: UDP-glucose 4-epimerase GalE [Gammaproteobacteria bacterium]|nr:UDP-glucose 4-epimerase GalE [Gammaproteobacteria bacterium]
MATVLVTGGTGYIGSHTVIQLQKAGYDVVIIDNLTNSKEVVIDRIESISGCRPVFVKADIRDTQTLESIFNKYSIFSVVHFAGLKSVGESAALPLKYYENNVSGTVNLCQVMARNDCKNIVFSSSATVYGVPSSVPVTEDFPTNPESPYGHSKLMVENILKDLQQSDLEWRVRILRYFNPIGAHSSGTLGEDPNDIPNNLLPFITQVAMGKLEKLLIFGNDYPTPDGTGIRDYIHVEDLASAHVKALAKIHVSNLPIVFNLGTGKGFSVMDVLKLFEKVTGKKVPYQITSRRPGDIAEYWADPTLAEQTLGWQAVRSLDAMLKDSWNWQQQNPHGYSTETV